MRVKNLLSIFPYLKGFRLYSKDVVPVFKSCLKQKHRVCLRDRHGEYTFLGLAKSSKRLGVEITRLLARQVQERVAVLCPSNAYGVLAMWAAWMSGQIVVPLNPEYPQNVIEYVLKDSDTALAITTAEYVNGLKDLVKKTNVELLVLDADYLDKAKANLQFQDEIITDNDLDEGLYGQDVEFYGEKDALLVYKSGNGINPRGAVLSFRNVDCQVTSIVNPWLLTKKDCVLNCRFLNTTDGITCGLLAPLSVGGSVKLIEKFVVEDVWAEILGVKEMKSERVNILLGESGMFRSLVEEYENVLKKNEKMEEYIKGTCIQKMRIMISTCSPLPKSVQEKWELYTGHEILEAYSLSEAGIVFTPTTSTHKQSSTVGLPVPGIDVKILSDDNFVMAEGNVSGTKISSKLSNKPIAGSLLIKGDNIARRYWGNKTDKSRWTEDNWLKTGDIASYSRGLYNILGCLASDIVKSNAYKISLLQIEAAILDLPEICDVAAFTITHNDISKIVAVVCMKPNQKLNGEQLKVSLLEKVPPYAVPDIFFDVPDIPRNYKGKIIRNEVVSKYIKQAQNLISSTNKPENKKLSRE